MNTANIQTKQPPLSPDAPAHTPHVNAAQDAAMYAALVNDPDACGAQIHGCDTKLVITTEKSPRDGHKTALKPNTSAALLHCNKRLKCLVALHADEHCGPTAMDAQDPLFILCTSGSAGEPEGAVHISGDDPVEAYGRSDLRVLSTGWTPQPLKAPLVTPQRAPHRRSLMT